MGEEVYNGVNHVDIVTELRRMGYGIDMRPGFGIALTVPSGRPRQYDGAPRHEPIGGATIPVYAEIRRVARDATDAARRVVAVSKGQTYSGEQNTAGESLDQQVERERQLRERLKQEALAELGIDAETVAAIKASKLAKPKRVRIRKQRDGETT